MKKPFILFITGISTSGKSAMGQELRELNLDKRIRIHDIDGNGVPEAGKRYWRRYRIEELLLNSIRNFEQGFSTIISGIVLPFEVIESRHFKTNANIHFLLLEMRMADFRQRMRDRIRNSTAIGPISKIYEYNSDLNKRLKNQILVIKNGHVIKTADKSKKQVLSEILELINLVSN